MKHIQIILGSGLVGLGALTAQISSGATDSGAEVAYVGGTLIDGGGGAPVPDAVLIVRGTEIVAAGPAKTTTIPPGAQVKKVTGQWVVPGLIDAHVHFMESGRHEAKSAPTTTDPKELAALKRTYAKQVAWIQQRAPYTLARYLCAGVTSAISLGGPPFEFEVKKLAARPGAVAPTVFAVVGPITTVPSAKIFQSFAGHDPLVTAQTPEEGTQAVIRGYAAGADLVKLVIFGVPGLAEPDPLPMIRAATQAAHERHLRADIHILDSKFVDPALDAGVDELAHTPGGAALSPSTIQRLKERSVVVTSTLLIWKRMLETQAGHIAVTAPEQKCGDPEVLRSWKEEGFGTQHREPDVESDKAMLQPVIDNMKLLHGAGIPFAVGTDGGFEGVLHGASIHAELQAMSEAGFSPMELIVAATRNGARVLGKENVLGSIAPGHQADFLILNADPLKDIRNLSEIAYVVHRGHEYAESDLLPKSSTRGPT